MLAAFAAQAPERAKRRLPRQPAAELRPPPPEDKRADDYPEGDPFAKEELDATRRINLDELKFGRNYNGEE